MATLAELKTKVRERADMVNSNFVEDDELAGYISASYSELYDLLVSAFEDYYIEDPLEFTVPDGSSTFDLPANFYKSIGVDISCGGDGWNELSPFMFKNRNRQRVGERNGNRSSNVEYRFVGGKIRFTPTDQAANTYRLWFVPRASALVLDTDVVDGVNGWEEYIVVDAAIKCMQKEESDVSVLMAQKSALMSRIQTMAQNRDAGETQRVTDVRGCDDTNFWSY